MPDWWLTQESTSPDWWLTRAPSSPDWWTNGSVLGPAIPDAVLTLAAAPLTLDGQYLTLG